ncbi:MAG: YqzL family protein [Armatimonadetes bacterium]|nr:YqzL family protein [Armatimonadota bacterium]
MLFTAEFFWRLFAATGSIKAYMLYRRFALH